jgi:hypothetical protein
MIGQQKSNNNELYSVSNKSCISSSSDTVNIKLVLDMRGMTNIDLTYKSSFLK